MSNNEGQVLSPKSRIPTISQKSSFVSGEYIEPKNIENSPKLEESPNSEAKFFSPRIKQTKKTKAPATYIVDEEFPSEAKKGNFNQFLSKIELFQKAKNDKILCMRAIKKQQEDKEIKGIPKVQMSEMSKKILEEKKKREGKSPGRSTASPSYLRVQSEKQLSYSSRKTVAKPKSPQVSHLDIQVSSKSKEAPSQYRTEKVLASKFIKEYTKTFEEISRGKFLINEDDTRYLLKKMLFLSSDIDNSVKLEIEEKLFIKMWKITGSEEAQSISTDSLKTFLLGVMNFFLPSMAHNQSSGQLGKVIFNRYHLNQEEVLKIHRVFLPFYENRVESLKKNTFTQKLEKFLKMQELFKLNKPEKVNIVKNFPGKPINERKFTRSEVKHNIKTIIKKPEKSTCITPASKKANLNTSFRSARSLSRSKSRGPLSGRSSVSENEWVGVNHDQISDPSIILKAQDILGAFSLKKSVEKEAKVENNGENPFKSGKNEPNVQKKDSLLEKNRKGPGGLASNSQKLIFSKKNHILKTVNIKPIDDDLKKATELLKARVGNEDTIIDVNLPDGFHKTLVIPKGSNHRQVVQKFANDYNLSLEMAKTLLNSINNS